MLFGNQNFYRHNQQFLTILLALRATGEFTTLRARGQSKRARKHVGTLRSGLTACEPSSHVLHAQTLHVLQHSTCLRATCLREELFAAAAMQAVQKNLMAMKVAELKEELEARGEAKTGCKAWLRRRLHAAIVRMHLEARDAEDGL
jgi:hypothetical protein